MQWEASQYRHAACAVCGGGIPEGETVVFEERQRLIHPSCYAPAVRPWPATLRTAVPRRAPSGATRRAA